MKWICRHEENNSLQEHQRGWVHRVFKYRIIQTEISLFPSLFGTFISFSCLITLAYSSSIILSGVDILSHFWFKKMLSAFLDLVLCGYWSIISSLLCWSMFLPLVSLEFLSWNDVKLCQRPFLGYWDDHVMWYACVVNEGHRLMSGILLSFVVLVETGFFTLLPSLTKPGLNPFS